MTFARDPLSVRYDQVAERRVVEAFLARERPLRSRWVYAAVPRPKTVRGLLGTLDSGGLTQWERAYQRSLFWNAKRAGIGNTFASGWRLQVQWGPQAGGGRQVALRVLSRAEAARHRVPARDQWTKNAALQSGGVGSVKQRFG